MIFARHLYPLLRRIASIEIAHASTEVDENGALVLEVLAVVDGQIGAICSINEHATDAEISQFEQQLDLLESSALAQNAEDAQREIQIREILGRLTPEERLLIERPLPEDLPPDDDGEEHF
jgi:hypothetical protein